MMPLTGSPTSSTAGRLEWEIEAWNEVHEVQGAGAMRQCRPAGARPTNDAGGRRIVVSPRTGLQEAAVVGKGQEAAAEHQVVLDARAVCG